ncbi:MAG: DUF3883 domain-containing protein [Ignavibacteriae bacterium]|nr:DUF3883 domain-containing protein [Ignavibacteriota bacterium]
MERIVFLNIGWMKSYRGISNDKIVGGGSFVEEHGYGHEMFNFLPYEENLFGYVRPRGGSINLGRLGAKSNQEHIGNVLAVWVSRAPSGGVYVIGWYKNARLYKNVQFLTRTTTNRHFRGEDFGYYLTARASDCILLPLDERVLRVPRKTKGGMGQSNVWYADKDAILEFKQKVLEFIRTRRAPKDSQHTRTKKSRAWQADPLKRLRIEEAAIKRTVKYYESLGYDVDSVERDNVGWDLEATFDGRLLRLEVKGLSQQVVSIEMTPNEYAKMCQHKESYRICVLTKALSQHPRFHVFSFSPKSCQWENDSGEFLNITEIISARMSL